MPVIPIKINLFNITEYAIYFNPRTVNYFLNMNNHSDEKHKPNHFP